MSTPPPIPGFHGRETELAWLRGLFEEVAETRSPRVAVVVAESGVGKTRLVQALYQQLTVDPRWDPPESNYWPDAFQARTGSMKVNPDLGDHTPSGPPRFMWLGMRWQDPGARNVEERACPIPEARDALRQHAELSERFASIWASLAARGRRRLQDLASESAVDLAADIAGLPLAGMLRSGARSVADVHRNRRRGGGHHEAMEQQYRDAGEELVATLAEIHRGLPDLPMVILLDDAQWIDATTLRMVDDLVRLGRDRQWPLLIVATHWEREWREGLASKSESPPTDLPSWHRQTADRSADAGPSTARVLEPAADDPLRYTLQERFPGLPAEQQDLIVRKASGNFLTMMENLGELQSMPEFFEGEDVTRPLTRAGVRHIEHWESDREKRVVQRFRTLSSELRRLLGWSSRIGERFLTDVVLDFAERSGIPDSRGSLSRCIDPAAVLTDVTPAIHEFRDRAFHRAAAAYFEQVLEDDRAALDAILTEHLQAWVFDSFDADGKRQPAAKTRLGKIDDPDRTIILDLAVRHAHRLVDAGGEAGPHDLLGRALTLLGREYRNTHDTSSMQELHVAIKSCRWRSIFEDVSFPYAIDLASDLKTCGCFTDSLLIYKSLWLHLLAVQSRRNPAIPTVDEARDLSRQSAVNRDSQRLGMFMAANIWSLPALSSMLSIRTAIGRLGLFDAATGSTNPLITIDFFEVLAEALPQLPPLFPKRELFMLPLRDAQEHLAAFGLHERASRLGRNNLVAGLYYPDDEDEDQGYYDIIEPIVQAMRQTGENEFLAGQPQAAARLWHEAQRELEVAASHDPDGWDEFEEDHWFEIQADLARAYYAAGKVERATTLALDVLQWVSRYGEDHDTTTEDTARRLLATIREAEGRNEEARDELEKVVANARHEITDATRIPPWTASKLINALRELGAFLQFTAKDHEAARNVLDERLALARQMTSDVDSFGHRRALIDALVDRARWWNPGHPHEVRSDLFDEAIAIARRHLALADTPTCLGDLGRVLLRYGEVLDHAHQAGHGYPEVKEAVELRRRLDAEFPSPSSADDLQEAEDTLERIRSGTLADIEIDVDFDDPDVSELQIVVSLEAAERIEASDLATRLKELLETVRVEDRERDRPREQGDDSDA